MAIFTFWEIFDAVIMTLIVGFIFSDTFRKPVTEEYDPLKYYKPKLYLGDFKFAALVTAPGIILHELGHKFVAIAFGMSATFNASYTFLGLGLALKILNFPVFFVPAYVSIIGTGTPLQSALIAFAGPAVNLILWLGSSLLVKYKLVGNKYSHLFLLTGRINMFLFIFNMLPIPPFDGNQVFMGLIQAFF